MQEPQHDRNRGPELKSPSFDIFQVEAGGVVWRGATATFEDAKKRIQELASASPADYIIWDRNTGDKHTINSRGRKRGGGGKE